MAAMHELGLIQEIKEEGLGYGLPKAVLFGGPVASPHGKF